MKCEDTVNLACMCGTVYISCVDVCQPNKPAMSRWMVGIFHLKFQWNEKSWYMSIKNRFRTKKKKKKLAYLISRIFYSRAHLFAIPILKQYGSFGNNVYLLPPIIISLIQPLLSRKEEWNLSPSYLKLTTQKKWGGHLAVTKPTSRKAHGRLKKMPSSSHILSSMALVVIGSLCHKKLVIPNQLSLFPFSIFIY